MLLAATACHGSDSGVSLRLIQGNVNILPPPKPDVTLTLPSGFTATVFADGLGKARHIAITPTGYVYVKLAGAETEIRLSD